MSENRNHLVDETEKLSRIEDLVCRITFIDRWTPEWFLVFMVIIIGLGKHLA